MKGCFAVAGAGRIRFYAYRSAGIHDCHFTGNDFLFSDSFRLDRSDKRGPNGCVMRNGKVIDPTFFDANDVGCVRGMAGSGTEMVVGLSFPGGGAERLRGAGGLMLLQDWAVTHRISLPCAQVYDVLREDGRSFDSPPATSNFEEATRQLESALGPPVLETPLKDTLMPKNLNVSLNGAAESSIGEYLA
jgi:hypothetical protein